MNLKYAHMFNNNVDTTVSIPGAGVFVEIPSGFSAGLLNGFTFQNNKELKCNFPGIYIALCSVSGFTASVANKTFEAGIFVNGLLGGGVTHSEVSPGGSGRPETMSGHVILDLNLNDLISIYVENHDDGTDLVVNHALLTLVLLANT
jgi:hypothetical protein